MTYRHQARVILHASAEEIARRQRWLRDDLEPLGEDRCAYETSDDSLEWLAMRIAFLGVDFEVVEPPELAEWCAALARRFGAAASVFGDDPHGVAVVAQAVDQRRRGRRPGSPASAPRRSRARPGRCRRARARSGSGWRSARRSPTAARPARRAGRETRVKMRTRRPAAVSWRVARAASSARSMLPPDRIATVVPAAPARPRRPSARPRPPRRRPRPAASSAPAGTPSPRRSGPPRPLTMSVTSSSSSGPLISARAP